MGNESLSSGQIAAIERCESAALEGFYRAAPPGLAAALGIHAEKLDGVLIAQAAGFDVLAFNRVVGLGVETPATEEQIDAIIERYRAAGVARFFVQICPIARPSGLLGWLAARGLRHHNNWVKHVRAVETVPVAQTDLTIRSAGPEDAPEFGRLVSASFGWQEAAAAWFGATIGLPGWRAYLALDGEQPVATATLFVHEDGIGGFFMASTDAAHRGRGAQSALIARRIADARALGCRSVAVETAEERPEHPSPSYRNIRRSGFDVAYLRPNHVMVLGAGS